MSARTRIAPAAVAAALSLAVVVAPASATKPVGECTQSYSPYTLGQWLDIAPNGSDVFQQVDLTEHDFRNRSFTRLEQLQYLIRTEQIDDRFFWTI